MRQRSRIRRVAKWAGVGVCVLIMVAWAFSRSFDVSLGDYRAITLTRGQVMLRGLTDSVDDIKAGRDAMQGMTARWRFTQFFEIIEHWPNSWSDWSELGLTNPQIARFEGEGRVYWHVLWLPLWLPLLAAAIPTAILFNRDRHRIPPGHCMKCGYDLTGNTSGVCSECGTKRWHTTCEIG